MKRLFCALMATIMALSCFVYVPALSVITNADTSAQNTSGIQIENGVLSPSISSGEITLSYIVAGQTVTKTVAVKGGDIVRVELLAYELGTPITVTAGGASGELNFAGYLALISEPSAELTALADAIAIYGAKAAAYMQ